jgi:thiamine-monophosphate kinase
VTPEFELIRRHFTRPAPGALLGVGDDCALLAPSEGQVLAVTTDMLVSGRHFLPDDDPHWLGHKCVAVNLSDLAAMGARPRWITLAIALPAVDDTWLAQFAAGVFDLCGRHGVDLVGGDTTAGPLNVCIQAIGEVPADGALKRSRARIGDDVWISGELGGAALGLACLAGRVALDADERAACLVRLHAPQPRVALGLALRGVAHAAIDISDGLAADLGHICERSGVAARIELDRLPAAPAVRARLDRPVAREALLAGGDDYELVFTAGPDARERIAGLGPGLGVPLARVGTIHAGAGVTVVDRAGAAVPLARAGYDHFA